MAKDRLIRSALAAAILVAGAGAETASGATVAACLTDWIVGAAFVAAALRPAHRSRLSNLSLLTATTWFAGTLSEFPEGRLQGVGAAVVLLYRGPLLHQLASPRGRTGTSTAASVLIALGYSCALLPAPGSASATAVVAGILAVLVLRGALAGAPADRRRSEIYSAALLLVLASCWGLFALDGVNGDAAAVLGNGLLIVTAWHLSRSTSRHWLRDAVGALVVDLGPATRPASPVSTVIAAALADPALEIRVFQPDTGWIDELGRPSRAPDPTTNALTDVATGAGGRVVLVHTPGGAGDSDLARAAASAAAHVLESARLSAQVRREAHGIRQSGARLLNVDDIERRMLAQRLREGTAGRLERLHDQLETIDDDTVRDIGKALKEVLDDLDRLARGLYPATIATKTLPEALQELTSGPGLPFITTTLTGPVAELPSEARALAYFFCSECLTNVLHHARASSATLTVDCRDGLTIEVGDNGRGGASLAPGRGLQGLADRVRAAGGSIQIDSPLGGPTNIRAAIPRPLFCADPSSSLVKKF